MDAKLVVVAGKADKQEIDLSLPMIIGRQRDADLVVIHKSVSRHHCEIFERQGRLMVRDNQSSNGTFVNDRQVGESVLNPGDRLTVGPLTFVAKYNPYGGEPIEVEDEGLDMALAVAADDPAAGIDLPEARETEGSEDQVDLASFGITAAEEPAAGNDADGTFQWDESHKGLVALGESSSIDMEFEPQAPGEEPVEVPLPAPQNDAGELNWSETLPEAESPASFLPPQAETPAPAAGGEPVPEDLAETIFFTPGTPRKPKGLSHPPLERKADDENLGAWLAAQDAGLAAAPASPQGPDAGLWDDSAPAEPLAPEGLPPMAGIPMAGVPMAGIPMAGVPMAGVPMAGTPMAVPMEVTEFGADDPFAGSGLEEEASAPPAAWPAPEGGLPDWPALDDVPVEDLGVPAGDANSGWPAPVPGAADPFAQWSSETAAGPTPTAEPMELTAEDLAEAAASPEYDWASATAEAAAEDQAAPAPGKDTMDFGAWMATSAQTPGAELPQPAAGFAPRLHAPAAEPMELSPDDLSAEDEPVPSWGESDMVPAIDDSSTELPPAANAEESAMIIEQQVDEVAVEPIAELSFDDLTEDNVAPTEPSGEQPSFFIPEGQPDPVPADQPFPFFTTEEGAKPSDEEIDPNQFNFEKW